jgi:hypothetical protein
MRPLGQVECRREEGLRSSTASYLRAWRSGNVGVGWKKGRGKSRVVRAAMIRPGSTVGDERNQSSVENQINKKRADGVARRIAEGWIEKRVVKERERERGWAVCRFGSGLADAGWMDEDGLRGSCGGGVACRSRGGTQEGGALHRVSGREDGTGESGSRLRLECVPGRLLGARGAKSRQGAGRLV